MGPCTASIRAAVVWAPVPSHAVEVATPSRVDRLLACIYLLIHLFSVHGKEDMDSKPDINGTHRVVEREPGIPRNTELCLQTYEVLYNFRGLIESDLQLNQKMSLTSFYLTHYYPIDRMELLLSRI